MALGERGSIAPSEQRWERDQCRGSSENAAKPEVNREDCTHPLVTMARWNDHHGEIPRDERVTENEPADDPR